MAPIPSGNKKALGNVLVVGGCGFLGHHLVNMVVDSYSAKVSVVDLQTTRNRRPESDGVQYHDADITNSEQLLAIFKKVKPDVVFHTASPAANAGVPNKILYKVNVEGTKCVIDCCVKTDVKALVYTSSASVISDNVTDLINADERWPVLRAPSQTDFYSDTKVIFLRKSLEISNGIFLGGSRNNCPRRKPCQRVPPPHCLNSTRGNQWRGRRTTNPSNDRLIFHKPNALSSWIKRKSF